MYIPCSDLKASIAVRIHVREELVQRPVSAGIADREIERAGHGP